MTDDINHPNAFRRFTDQGGTIRMSSQNEGGPGAAVTARDLARPSKEGLTMNERSAPAQGASEAVPCGGPDDLAAAVGQALSSQVTAEHDGSIPPSALPASWVDVRWALRQVLDDIATDGPMAAVDHIAEVLALGVVEDRDIVLYDAASARLHQRARRRGCGRIEGVSA
jgi:hypothetical protein